MRHGRPGHQATTRHMQAAYPFMAEGGLGGRGVYIGTDAYGGSFLYDPWALYQRAITSPNMLVIGQLGYAKSALIKTYLYRQAVFGRIAWVLDPKGEYGGLAEELGAVPIRLRPGGDVRLNPLTPRAGWEGQLALLQAIAAGTLRRPLHPEEEAALREALRFEQARSDEEPVLPAIVERLLRPDAQMAERLATDAAALARAARQAALALQRLCEGDLAGMFDGPTTPGLDLDGRLVVLDLSAVFDNEAIGLLMTCAVAWLRALLSERAQAATAGGGASGFLCVLDECWRALSIVGVGEFLQDAFKKSRAYGIQNIAVMHRLSDLRAAGDQGSRMARLAEGLLADTETRVVYHQEPDQVPLTRELLGLSGTECELLPQLERGEALWKVGRRSFLVRHRISPHERELVDTDGSMRAAGAGIAA